MVDSAEASCSMVEAFYYSGCRISFYIPESELFPHLFDIATYATCHVHCSRCELQLALRWIMKVEQPKWSPAIDNKFQVPPFALSSNFIPIHRSFWTLCVNALSPHSKPQRVVVCEMWDCRAVSKSEAVPPIVVVALSLGSFDVIACVFVLHCAHICARF